MSQLPVVLSPLEVREYIGDYSQNNYLLAGQEFSDTRITLAMELAVGVFNDMTPQSKFNTSNFPNKNLLLTGTLWKMYDGIARQYFRNQLEYSDGGVQVNLEEKGQAYAQMASNSRDEFMTDARAMKIAYNLNTGWGEIRSDDAFLPMW